MDRAPVRRPGPHGAGRRAMSEDAFKVFLGQIAPGVTEQQLTQWLEEVGGVTPVALTIVEKPGAPVSCAFATFASSEQADLCLQIDGRQDRRVSGTSVQVALLAC